MNFTSYAQNFEDVILWRALHDVSCGQYVDVGAQDPIIDSVSFAFYANGWRGIHVEATPSYAEKLRQARPDEMVIEAAITDAPGPIEFHEICNTGLSTGKRDIAQQHQEAGYQERKLLVPCIRLDRLLETVNGDVHWMKIDVEGMEPEVVRSWGESSVRPWVVVIEATYPNSQRPSHEPWLNAVLNRGYREVHFDGLSRYFVHESHREREAAFQAPVNIFDNFVTSRDHFTARAIRGEIEEAEQNLRDEQARSAEDRSHAAEIEQRLADEQSHAAELGRQLADAMVSLAAARKGEAEALKAFAEGERAHGAAFEAYGRSRDASESELRREFIETTAGLRTSLRDMQWSKAALEKQLTGERERTDELLERLRDAERQRFESDRVRTEVERTLHELDRAGTQQRRDSELIQRQLGRELELTRTAALQADALIRAAVAERPGRWTRLGRAIGLSSTSERWRALSAWSFDLDFSRREPTRADEAHAEDHHPTQMRAESRNPYLRAASLDELLNWNDLDFVRCAYVTMLGRQPDAAGEAYYAGRLRSGHSKLELLWQLRRSSEGRRHDPGIAGLDRALKQAAWERKPVLGTLVRGFTGGPANDKLARMQRSLENELGTLRDRVSTAQASGPVPGSGEAGASGLADATAEEEACELDLSPAAQKSMDMLLDYKSR